MGTIRKIGPGHLGQLCALETELFDAGSFPLSRRNFAYHIKKGNILLGAFEGEVLAGYILLFTYPKSSRIYSIGVHPRFQGRRIGSGLLERAAEIARGMHKEHLSLEVRADNPAALRLYQSRGFTPLRKLRAYYPDGADGIKMRLLLQ